MSGGVVEVTTTVSNRTEGLDLSARLVEERLAACGQVSGPISSTYHWHGKIERSEEYVLRLKTAAARVAELVARLRDLHSYDVPEILVSEVTDGNPEYFDWVSRETSSEDIQP